MKEYIDKDAARDLMEQALVDEWEIQYADDRLDEIPTADVPPALWTDAPIVGTEFMTHSQGQGGFEIHFRTDSREKYGAVQEECRRQIDHTKPAADVVEVRHGRWVHGREVGREYVGDCLVGIFYDRWTCSECGYVVDDHEYSRINYKFCPNCGAKMDGGGDE